METAADLLRSTHSSKTIPSQVGFIGANIGTRDYTIHSGIAISISKPQATAIVTHSFPVEVAPTEEGYIATSRISNAFELGASASEAVRNYLEFLVDELIWLQKHEKELSTSIREDLRHLQHYLRIV